MSSYQVIAAVTNVMREILWASFDQEPTIKQFIPTRNAIVFANPTDTARDSGNRMSIWCYRIEENEFIKNSPMRPGPDSERDQYPPLALNLYYLLTPFALSGAGDHLVLGKTMQTLYDNGTVLIQDNVAQIAEELRIIFCRLTLEELTRIWEALREPYRLSICYQVRVTTVDSERESTAARVFERITGLDSKDDAEEQL